MTRRVSCHRLFALLPVVLLTGCMSLTPQVSPAPASYDLGPLEPAAARMPLLAEVTAPSWLDQPAMRYRLAYADPREVRSYTRSRWVAAPSQLLAQRLRQRWPGPDLAGCRLAISVDEWIHEFAATGRSQVVLAVEVRVFAPGGRLLAQRAVRQTAVPSRHDAPGMAAASGVAVDDLVREVSVWVDGATRSRLGACGDA